MSPAHKDTISKPRQPYNTPTTNIINIPSTPLLTASLVVDDHYSDQPPMVKHTGYPWSSLSLVSPSSSSTNDETDESMEPTDAPPFSQYQW